MIPNMSINNQTIFKNPKKNANFLFLGTKIYITSLHDVSREKKKLFKIYLKSYRIPI